MIKLNHSINGKRVVNFWQIDGSYNVELEDGSKSKVSRNQLRFIINKFYSKLNKKP